MTNTPARPDTRTKAIVYAVILLTDAADNKGTFPAVPPLILRILRELAEQAVRPDGGRPLSAGDLSDITGSNLDRINDNIQRIPGLLAIYAASTRVSLVRFPGHHKNKDGRPRNPTYELTLV